MISHTTTKDDIIQLRITFKNLFVFLQSSFWRARKVCFSRVFPVVFIPSSRPRFWPQRPQTHLCGDYGQATAQPSLESHRSHASRRRLGAEGGCQQVQSGQDHHHSYQEKAKNLCLQQVINAGGSMTKF